MAAYIDSVLEVERMLDEEKEKKEIISFLSEYFPDKHELEIEKIYIACLGLIRRKKIEEEQAEILTL
jgi:hypothetical protein